ncbi:MAG: hypothetical protein NTW53_16395 [Burkholderiales bacterium]|nr:hypothetical protein [Burkholderiales bacterium]
MIDGGDDVFSFLSLRPIRRPQSRTAASGVIRDDSYEGATRTNGGGIVGGRRVEADLFSDSGASAVGAATFRSVARRQSPVATAEAVLNILSRPTPQPSGVPLAPVVTTLRVRSADAARLSAMAGRPQVALSDRIVVFPATADDIAVPLTPSLTRLRAEVEALMAELLVPRLAPSSLPLIHAVTPPLAMPPFVERVFSLTDGGYAPNFAATKRILFDAVYGLTVLRKSYPVDASPAIAGLQTLHAMERLAIAFFAVHAAEVRGDNAATLPLALLAATLSNAWPDLAFGTEELAAARDRLKTARMPFDPDDAEGPRRLMQAQPVVPPLFVRLRGAFQPFNSLRPVGIGDLMVVRQTFQGYRKGEIARVETVMAGETKDRTMRRLDRSEDTQTFALSEDFDTTTENTTTERFELKREAEAVLKTDIAAGLNASVTYKGDPVVSTVTANASLSVGKSDSEKLARNFARDVTDRALSRVQRKSSQTRSRTLISEIEDTEIHRLSAPQAQKHVNGFYRWIDKVYRAEVRNYGRRLMFELVVPEPAAFHVQSRLLAHLATLDLPNYPVKPKAPGNNSATVEGIGNSSQITPESWQVLNAKYNLDDMPPPAPKVDGVSVIQGNGTPSFVKSSKFFDSGFLTDDFGICRVSNAPVGYEPTSVRVEGSASFRNKGEPAGNYFNEFQVVIGTMTVFSFADENNVNWNFGSMVRPLPAGVSPWGPFNLYIKTKTSLGYNVTIAFDYSVTAATMDAWRRRVFAALVPARLRPVTNTGAPVADPAIDAYLKEIKDTERATVRQVIQGSSSAANRRRVEQELKRLSISQFTREFDAQPVDDVIGVQETMAELPVQNGFRYPAMTITPGTADKPATVVTFDPPNRPLTGYQVPDIELSRQKGVHIQFIEHAFEWTNMSWVFYPYYWATPPKWVELLDREDDADPFFTDFLQAGAARVLIAVRPGFEDAVLHYLATREPWAGGSVPLIGDDLHVPIHEEIRELTEDSAGTGTLVGQPWTVTVPTSLIFLESTDHPLPDPWPLPPSS